MQSSRKNTMGKTYFLFAHIYWLVLSYVFFSATLFRRLNLYIFEERITESQSKGILILLMVVSYTVGVTSSLKCLRNHWQIARTVIAPYGVYLVLEVLPHIPTYMCIASRVLLFAICYQLTQFVTTPIHRGRDISRVLWDRFRRLICNTRVVADIFLLLLVIANVFNPVVEATSVLLVNGGEPQSVAEYAKTITACRTELEGLDEVKWQDLSAQERAELLQLVADIESNYLLGLPNILRVEVSDLERGTIGTYTHSKRLIQIDRVHLLNDSAEECIDTVLHEVFHSYQRYLCDALECVDENYRNLRCFTKVQKYHSEFSNYINGKTNFGKYYIQTCEQDAREYATTRYRDYVLELGQAHVNEE